MSVSPSGIDHSPFLNQNKFSLIIESNAKAFGISYMEAVLEYCDQNDMDIEAAAKLINKSLKQKIELECDEMNLLKRNRHGRHNRKKQGHH